MATHSSRASSRLSAASSLPGKTRRARRAEPALCHEEVIGHTLCTHKLTQPTAQICQSQARSPRILPRCSGPTPPEGLEQAHLFLSGRRVHFETGRLHVVDVSLPHCVVNLADRERRTLVLLFMLLVKAQLAKESRAVAHHGDEEDATIPTWSQLFAKVMSGEQLLTSVDAVEATAEDVEAKVDENGEAAATGLVGRE